MSNISETARRIEFTILSKVVRLEKLDEESWCDLGNGLRGRRSKMSNISETVRLNGFPICHLPQKVEIIDVEIML